MAVQFRQRGRRPRYADPLGQAVPESIRQVGATSRSEPRNSFTLRLSNRGEAIKRWLHGRDAACCRLIQNYESSDLGKGTGFSRADTESLIDPALAAAVHSAS